MKPPDTITTRFQDPHDVSKDCKRIRRPIGLHGSGWGDLDKDRGKHLGRKELYPKRPSERPENKIFLAKIETILEHETACHFQKKTHSNGSNGFYLHRIFWRYDRYAYEIMFFFNRTGCFTKPCHLWRLRAAPKQFSVSWRRQVGEAVAPIKKLGNPNPNPRRNCMEICMILDGHNL